MLDFKKSGSRLISSKNHAARIKHHCCNEHPECGDSNLFPGDLYERQVWIHWWRADNGEIFSRLQVKKYHVSPCCMPDPDLFESEEEADLEVYRLLLAA
jgi:hypothetical protein